MKIGVKKLNSLSKVPTYVDGGASGFDLYATNAVVIQPMWSAEIETGVALEIPECYEVQIRGRSGLAFNKDVFAHVGTIDESYKGEIKIKLFNFGTKPIPIFPGMRIAQGVLAPVEKAEFVEVDELSESSRGSRGFGSSGMYGMEE